MISAINEIVYLFHHWVVYIIRTLHLCVAEVADVAVVAFGAVLARASAERVLDLNGCAMTTRQGCLLVELTLAAELGLIPHAPRHLRVEAGAGPVIDEEIAFL